MKPHQQTLDQCEHDQAGMLKRRAVAALKPSKPQLPCDVGLFSDEADQLDLVSLFRER
jgi:hypothetical protein